MKYKKCVRCNKDLPLSYYFKTGRINNTTGKDIIRASCKSCVRKVKQARNRNIRAWLNQFKANAECQSCGYSQQTHPNFCTQAIEFHHTKNDKSFNIGDATGRGFSIKAIEKEINKCIILCTRCHVETHNQ